MPSSQQVVEPRPVSPGQVAEWIRRYNWDTMPGRLWAALIILVLGVLLAGGVGVYAAITRVNTTGDIAKPLEPLSADVTRLYQSLADADATVAAGYLSVGVEPKETQIHYSQDIDHAAVLLAEADAQAGGTPVIENSIANISRQLPVYTGLVERARANNRQGFAVGASYLRSASELMRTSILPEATTLQQQQAAQLGNAYRRAAAVPFVALGSCLVSLAGLGWAQVFLFRRTHRVFNVGLVLASVAVLAGLVLWIGAGTASSAALASAGGHSRLVSDELGPAQVAALQARAYESLGLVDRDVATIEPQFTMQMHSLEGNNGAGGVLGKAEQSATDQRGKELVRQAIDAARSYATAHDEVHKLDAMGNYSGAVNAVVGPQQPSATAFDRLNSALSTAIAHEREVFRSDIARAQGWLTGLPIITGGLALLAAVGVERGIRQRLREYQ